MNKINSEVKLDFSDVLIEPCISDKSLTRKSVNIETFDGSIAADNITTNVNNFCTGGSAT